MGLFGFVQDMDNYKERVVARFERGDLVVDTTRVSDSREPYETGIRHPAYNDGRWVIVETYASKVAAQAGHERWVKRMTAAILPAHLRDVSTAETAMCRDVADESDGWREKERGLPCE